MAGLEMFWWFFAARGGFALLFALLLLSSGSLFGTIFFDPVMYVVLGLLLGFYVLVNGVLLGVAAKVAFKEHPHIAWLLASEGSFAIVLGGYIGFSLMMTKESLALLAGLHAFGVGAFQGILGFKLRRERSYAVLLGCASILGLAAGVWFLTHTGAETSTTAGWLSVFELTYGTIIVLFARALHQSWVSAKVENPS